MPRLKWILFRVLQAERSARRAGVLQVATLNMVAAGSLLNLGITLSGQGASGLATASFVGAGLHPMFPSL